MQENAVKDGVRVRREARWDQTYPTVPSRIPALTLTAFFDIPRWVLVQNSEAPYAHTLGTVPPHEGVGWQRRVGRRRRKLLSIDQPPVS